MIKYFVFSMVSGFLVAAVLHKIFRDLLRFRAEWTSTFIASMLTCMVSGMVFASSMIGFKDKSEFADLLIFATTFTLSYITGLLAFRLIIKSESGRSLSWPLSAMASFSLCAPPLILVGVVNMLSADF